MQLLEIIKENNLEVVESKSILEKFGDYENIAREWEVKAKQIVVTDVSQTTEMAMAKEARKKFSQLRIDIEKARKEMKEQSLRKGQAIDSVARFLKSLVEPIEDYLRQQEDFIRIQEAKKLAEEKAEEERLAEIKRLAEEKAQKEEQERIRKENEELKRKSQEQEEAMRKEREAKEKEMKAKEAELEAIRVKSLQEKQKLEEEAKQQREAKEKAEKELKNMIECPHCGKKFKLDLSQQNLDKADGEGVVRKNRTVVFNYLKG